MKSKLENLLNQRIVSMYSVGGGCIADSKVVLTEGGEKYFVKQYEDPRVNKSEANGLIEIAKSNSIRVPKVIHVDDEYLVLEFVTSNSQVKGFGEVFGQQFASMHKTISEQFGFYEDNFIGSTHQKNIPQKENWIDFYYENRLLYQFNLAEKNGYLDSTLKNGIDFIEKILPNILTDSDEPPTLLHGDLWSGNYISDERGMPCLIDPAVYYGHREADLAMTKLFGGFSTEFYSSYNEAYPIKEGWEYRENIYKLYHVLNHLNLFGSGYYSQAVLLINSYK